MTKDVDSSTRSDVSSRSEREKEDRRAKREGRKQSGNSVPGAHRSSERSPTSRRSKTDDQKLKSKLAASSAGRRTPGAHSVTSSSDDRSSRKQRTGGSSDGTQKPGAVASTGEHRSSGKERRNRAGEPQKPGAVASKGEHRSSKKGGGNNASQSQKPGAVASTDEHGSRSKQKNKGGSAGAHHDKGSKSTDPASRKKARLAARSQNASSSGPDDKNDDAALSESEFILNAELVEDGEEGSATIPNSPNQHSRSIRTREPENTNEENTIQETTTQDKPPKKNCKYIVLAVIFVLLICGGAGTYFGTRKTSSVVGEKDTTLPGGNTDKGEPSNTTDAPSEPDVDKAPSAPPAVVNKYPPPNVQDCEKIANGEPRGGFNDTFTSRTIGIFLDVELQEATSLESQIPVLEDSISINLMPELVGCTELQEIRRQLASVRGGRVLQDSVRFVIFDGNVTVTAVQGGVCGEGTNDLCHTVLVRLALELQGNEFIIPIVSDVFFGTDPSLIEKMRLGAPFVRITARSLDLTDDNASSSSPSETPTETPTRVATQVPTPAPTIGETDMPVVGEPNPTEAPDPTEAPIVEETRAPVTTPLDPTLIPSPAPTKTPTIPPTPGPTLPEATSSPTSISSTNPSSQPSQSPSNYPSTSPSDTSSLAPSQVPTMMLSRSPSGAPTPKPSAAPSLLPSSSPTIRYSEVGRDLKCPLDASRIFKIDQVANTEECYNACLTSAHCGKFSVGSSAGSLYCIGCPKEAIWEDWGEDSIAYELTPGISGVNKWNIEVGQNTKCYFDDTRLFRITSGVSNVDECYEICKRTVNCAKFSFGPVGVDQELMCFGCPSTAGTQPEDGMNIYEFRPIVTLWEMDMEYGMKCPQDSTRLFSVENPVDAFECYNICMSTPGCSAFSFGYAFSSSFCMGCTSEAIMIPHDSFFFFKI